MPNPQPGGIRRTQPDTRSSYDPTPAQATADDEAELQERRQAAESDYHKWADEQERLLEQDADREEKARQYQQEARQLREKQDSTVAQDDQAELEELQQASESDYQKWADEQERVLGQQGDSASQKSNADGPGNADDIYGVPPVADNSDDVYGDAGFWEDEYGSQVGSGNSGDSSTDDNHDDTNDDVYTEPATDDEPPAPDPDPSDSAGGGGSADPDDDGEGTVLHHATHVHGIGGSHAGGPTHGGSSEFSDGGRGWGSSHVGSPREDDGDTGEDRPGVGRQSSPRHTSHRSGIPGSGLQGSTGDQDYVGGGYGWTHYGAPRANTSSSSSADSTISVGGSHGVSSGAGLSVQSEDTSTRPRFRWLITAVVMAAVPLAGLAISFGHGDEQSTLRGGSGAAAPTPAAMAAPEPGIAVPPPVFIERPAGAAPVTATAAQASPLTSNAESAPAQPIGETHTAPTGSALSPAIGNSTVTGGRTRPPAPSLTASANPQSPGSTNGDTGRRSRARGVPPVTHTSSTDSAPRGRGTKTR